MDPRIDVIASATNDLRPQRCCCVSCARLYHTQRSNSNEFLFDINDRTTLISNYRSKKKKHHCPRSSSASKSTTWTCQPWIAFVHVLCSATLALFGIYLTSNILIFENKFKEMDDISWRSLPYDLNTHLPISSTTENPISKDKCEPLYVLIYAHCFMWFLFLVLDHFARYLHHKKLRSRGHLRAFGRLSRLATIPFQLVSLWTVLLAIFITIYAQQDKADMQPYCDANMLLSPKNGIAVLLVFEFVCVTISSLLYANSVRKFSLNKPPPDVYGWEENNYFNRWAPQILQNDNATVDQQQNSENFSNYEHETKCLLDLLEYYTLANQELSTKLGSVSQQLRQLEVENKPQPSQSQY